MEPVSANVIKSIRNADSTNYKVSSAAKDVIKNVPESHGFSKEASEALRAQTLVSFSGLSPKSLSSGASKIVEYIKKDASADEIMAVLKDSKTTGRSFLGQKKKIVNMITTAKRGDLARMHLNLLLNAEEGKLSGAEIVKKLENRIAADNYNPADVVKTFRETGKLIF